MKKNSDQPSAKPTYNTPTAVVGIGASAGGLDALIEILKSLPKDTGLAFVILQHLSPDRESLSSEIFARLTEMPVREARGGLKVERNHIYLLPPDRDMTIEQLHLKLHAGTEALEHHKVIDSFFCSLANDLKALSIGVVLSGNASDGTLGLGAIKDEGGVTLAQDPNTAGFDGMPRSAIAAGVVDLILSPSEIAKELARISKHLSLGVSIEDDKREKDSKFPTDDYAAILSTLKKHTRVNFMAYKRATIERRISRRLVIHNIDSLVDYQELLEKDPGEVRSLFADLLINVTKFFRDNEAFVTLREKVFPELFKNKPPKGKGIRIWVPGCSSGEEVYSLAMSLLDYKSENNFSHSIQIFATDISDTILQTARLATYSNEKMKNVPEAFRDRFFIKSEGSYKIIKAVRDLCLFSKHDVTSDPPFAKIDLISCRNVLIYFSTELQKLISPIFYFSLTPGGYLFLGHSESSNVFSNLFNLIDKSNSIFSKKPDLNPARMLLPKLSPFQNQSSLESEVLIRYDQTDLLKEADRILLSKHVSSSVVVDGNLEIVLFRGEYSPYMELPSGEPNNSLMKLAHPELCTDLRSLMKIAVNDLIPAKKESICFKHEELLQNVDIEVVPLNPFSLPKDRRYLITFERSYFQNVNSTQEKNLQDVELEKRPEVQLVARLQQELKMLTAYHRSVVEEYEKDKLGKNATEEMLQVTNEEFQSTVEELETAKEELQSTNEELTTVNDELQHRNSELTELNNDLENFVSSAEIPIIMVDNQRRIRRFTPKATKLLNVLPADIGRPINDVKLQLSFVNFDEMISDVINTLVPKEIELQDQSQFWYRLRIRPYRTVDNKIDGAVISLSDIDALKKSRQDAVGENVAKTSFLYNMSHEIRTPLGALLGFSELLSLENVSQEHKQYLDAMKRNGFILLSLINNILDLAKVEAGKYEIEEEVIALDDLLVDVNAAVIFQAKEKNLKLTVALENSKFNFIISDRLKIRQILLNIIGNAIKFTDFGEVKLNVRLVQLINGMTQLLFIVQDTGSGVEQENTSKIFEPFSQGDSSITRKFGGTGLGLALARRFAQLLGGNLELTQSTPGKGSTFTASIVAKNIDFSKQINSKPGYTEVLASKPPQVIRIEGCRCLVVDDLADNRTLLAYFLESAGAVVDLAKDGKEALEKLKSKTFDAVIMDIQMPIMDGYTAVARIRKEGNKIPVIAVTAHAFVEEKERCLEKGFDNYLSKPINKDDLLEKVLYHTKCSEKS